MTKDVNYEMVKEFHETFGHPVKENNPSLDVTEITPERLKLRVNLVLEEAFELVGAAYNKKAQEHLEKALEELYSNGIDKNDKGYYDADVVEVADALADITVVVNGFALETGIPLPDVIEEVHASNMSKLGEDGKPIYRESDNKILKGPNYFRPNVAKAMGLEKDSENN